MVITFDIDGVLACVRDYVEKYLPHDWKGYFSHTLEFPSINPLVMLLHALQNDHFNHIYILTGRPESNRKATEEWLYQTLISCSTPLRGILMRSDTDHRHPSNIKMEWIQDIKPDLVVDDDPKLVVAATEAGFTVLQVHGYRSTPHDMVPTDYLD